MTYDERESGRPSRVAVLGLPERLWQSVAVDDFNKILSDTLLWLARRPDAYVATWPQAAGPAVMLAFDAPDPLTEQDLSLFSVAESFGGKANYFLLSEHLESAPESVQALLKETHHEVAWLGDRFEEFKDQPLNKQSRRIAVMLKEAAKVGLPVTAGAGFHAPMESYDGETSRALADKGFAYQITDSGVTDSLLPVLAKGLEGRDFLLYPRSMVAINGLLSGGLSPDVAAQQYAAALRTHLDLGGLTVIPVMQGEVFASVRWKQLMQSGFSAVRGKPWLASGREIATWWKAYRRVSATVDLSVSPPLLTVNIAGEENLQQPVSLLLNLPAKARSLRLVQDNTDDKAFAPNLSTHDDWRQRLSLEGVLPGTYHWYLLPDSGVQSMGQAQR
jgi:hypothetical protein